MTDESVTPTPPRPLTVKAFGITDKGKVRTTNEDQFLIAELTKAMRVWQTSLPEPKLQVGRGARTFVSGGRRHGRASSGRTGECPRRRRDRAVHAQFVQMVLWVGRHRSDRKFSRSSSPRFVKPTPALLEEAAEHPELSGMGTTVTMAFHLGAQLCVVHVGDSRAYLYRDGELHQLTQDHTLMADMVRSGALRPDEVAGHRLRHVITNVVGGPELGVKVEARALEVQAGDRLLLCSDGLTEMVTNEAIAATLDAEPAPEAAAKKLLAQANDGGASDNITLLIVRFEPVDSAAGNDGYAR